MAVTFDGPNKVISFNVSTTAVDVRDIYSDWVDWFLTSDNSKYLPAMRNVGGDPLPGSKTLGLTYFMLNGWKIKPYEENHTITFNGNLYSEDGSSPYMNVVGAYQVMIINSVSNLVDSTVAQLAEIEFASFQNGVTVNETTGAPGTAYPLGTAMAPSSNLTDALAIANARGLDQFFMTDEEVTVDSNGNYSGFEFHGVGHHKTMLTMSDGANVSDCIYRDSTVSGYLDSGTMAFGCLLTAITNGQGHFEKCLITGTVTLSGAAHFLDCWGGYGNPVINCGGSGKSLTIRNFRGPITITNKTGSDNLSIDMNSGHIILDSTVTGSNIVLRGIAKLTDNSVGATVDVTGLIQPLKTLTTAKFMALK